MAVSNRGGAGDRIVNCDYNGDPAGDKLCRPRY